MGSAVGTSFRLRRGKGWAGALPSPPHPGSLPWVCRGGGSPGFGRGGERRHAGQRRCPGARHMLAQDPSVAPLGSAALLGASPDPQRGSTVAAGSGLAMGWTRPGTGFRQPRGLRAALQALFLPCSPRTPHRAAQPSPNKGTVIARVPSHPRPCPTLGTSHPAAAGERGRSLSLFQVCVEGTGSATGSGSTGVGQ